MIENITLSELEQNKNLKKYFALWTAVAFQGYEKIWDTGRVESLKVEVGRGRAHREEPRGRGKQGHLSMGVDPENVRIQDHDREKRKVGGWCVLLE